MNIAKKESKSPLETSLRCAGHSHYISNVLLCSSLVAQRQDILSRVREHPHGFPGGSGEAVGENEDPLYGEEGSRPVP